MKNKSKLIIIIMAFIIFVQSVYGVTTVLESRYVSYDNSASGMSSTNVQDAIGEHFLLMVLIHGFFEVVNIDPI